MLLETAELFIKQSIVLFNNQTTITNDQPKG